MAEDRPEGTGTPGAEGASGSGAQPPVSAPDGTADGGSPAGTETVEELRERIRKSEQERMRLLSERSRTEERSRELEQREAELRRREESMRAGAGGPSAVPSSDIEVLMAQVAAQEEYCREYPKDVVAASSLMNLKVTLMNMQRDAARQALEVALETHVPEDKRASVRNLILTGRANTIRAALEMLDTSSKATEADSLKKRLEEVEEENKRLKERVAAAPAPVPGLGGHSGFGAQFGGMPAKERMTMAEYDRRISELEAKNDTAGVLAMQRRVDLGELVLTH